MSMNGIDFAEIVTLGNDPEPRVSNAGGSWATFRAAFTPRERDRQSGESKDGETTWISVKAFKQTADRIVSTFHKGDRALIKGKLSTERFTDNNGNERGALVLVVDEIGACPRFANVQITRQQRQDSRSQPGWATPATQQSSGFGSGPQNADSGFGGFGDAFDGEAGF